MEVFIELLPALMFFALLAGMFSGLPVAIVLMGIAMIFTLLALSLGEMRLLQTTLLPHRIFGGTIENPVLVAAPMFIFMGLILEKTRIAEDLMKTLQRVLQVFPGSLAVAVILVGTILAAATGIIGASVVMLTVMALPTMIEKNYSPALAAGSVASASTLGILIPPSVMLVFMGDLLGVNLARLFVAALLPGLLLASIYIIYIIFAVMLKPGIAPGLEPADEAGADELKQGLWRETILSLALPLILILSVLGSILGGLATPTEASGIGVVAALLLGLCRGRISVDTLNQSMDHAMKTLAMLFFIFVGATAFAFVFRSIGGDAFILDTARGFNLGDWGLLIMMMATIFIMGFFFDWIEITLIILPIFAPLVNLMDLDGHVANADMIYWFAILVAVNLQTSFLTPPFGYALFYLKGAAGNLLTMRQIYVGVTPFVLAQLIVLAMLIMWPEIIFWLPNQLLN